MVGGVFQDSASVFVPFGNEKTHWREFSLNQSRLGVVGHDADSLPGCRGSAVTLVSAGPRAGRIRTVNRQTVTLPSLSLQHGTSVPVQPVSLVGF